jgi:hypothetical protein
MNKQEMIQLGSETAKAGFQNEKDIVDRFNNWKTDNISQQWLTIMGYNINEIEKVFAIQLHGHKTDVQVQVSVYLKQAIAAENLTIKLVTNPSGFNQVDKRWVKNYVELWNIPPDVTRILKLFTGELEDPSHSGSRKDPRRFFLNEFSMEDQRKVVDFFTANKVLIICDIIKGRGQLSAQWMLVIHVSKGDWILKSINQAISTFADGDVAVTNRGSLKIGRITMQRKGGDGGRSTANMLQFKANPIDIKYAQ